MTTPPRTAWTKRMKRRLWAAWSAIRPENALPSAVAMDEHEFATLFLAHGGRGDVVDQVLADLAARPPSSWPGFPSHMTRGVPEGADDIVAAAQAILAGRITVSDRYEFRFDGAIDWERRLGEEERGRPTRALNRHYWWMIPVRAYQVTRDETYVTYLDDTIRHWVSSVPRPATKDEWSTSWALMEVGIRCLIWPSVFGVLAPSPRFTRDARLAMLRSLHDHAEFLTRYHNRTNHLLREANGLANVARTFPMFREATRWWEVAADRLHDALRDQVNDDGSHFELSNGYQYLAIEEFEYAISLLEEGGDHRLPDFRSRVLDMYRAAAAISRPDGSLPLVNDGYPAGSWQHAFLDAAERFDAPDLRYVATGGAAGLPPTRLSVHLPDAGWTAMRTGWEPSAAYLLFDSGPYGGEHGHEDALSIELFAHGTPFLVDPGCYTYEETDRFRSHFVSSRAHSTIVASGTSQVRRWLPGHHKPQRSVEPQGEWAENDVFAYASGAYEDGYAAYAMAPPAGAEIIDGVLHRRHVLHVKPDYWLLVDVIAAARAVSVELRFQAAAGLSVDLERPPVRLVAESGASLAITVDGAEHAPTIECGANDPIGGWWAPTWWEKTPAPALVWQWPDRDRLLVATLLEPSGPGSGAAPRTVTSVPLEGGSGAAWEIDGGGSRDLVVLGDDGGTRSVSGHTSTARVTVIRRSGEMSRRADW